MWYFLMIKRLYYKSEGSRKITFTDQIFNDHLNAFQTAIIDKDEISRPEIFATEEVTAPDTFTANVIEVLIV